MKGYELLATSLSEAGARHVFAMLGGTNVAWLAHGGAGGAFDVIKTRHEATAVTAAVGYARASGHVGFCTTTRGPGFANALTALTAASRENMPIVHVVAQPPPDEPNHPQQLDQRAATELTGAGFTHVHRAADLPHALPHVVRLARAGSPQVLSVDASLAAERVANVPRTAELEVAGTQPEAAAVGRAVDALAAAERPLVLAGQGAVLSGARDELEALVDRTGSFAATTLVANRFFSGHPSDVGLCGGWAPPGARDLLEGVDVVIAFGASMNRYTVDGGTLFADATIIHCDARRDAIGRWSRADIGLVGDARATARALCEEWQRRGLPHRGNRVPDGAMASIRSSVTAVELGTDVSRGLDPRVVYATLDEKLPPERIVVTDSGRSLPTLASLVDARDARSWLVGRGFGCIGRGLGMAIGAAVAQPDRPVLLFAGDGGFLMSSNDLDAVRLAGLDLTVVVMNDQQYGSEMRYLDRYGLPDAVARQSTPDLVTLARAYGGDGLVVDSLAALEQLELTYAGLFIVDVRIDPSVDGRLALSGHGATVPL